MVFKLLQKILSIFQTKPKISFDFFEDKKDMVKISIKYDHINNPEYIASVIYALNNGLFLDKIVTILLDNLKKEKNKDLTSNILSKLDTLYIIDQQNDLIIKPLEAFDKNVK